MPIAMSLHRAAQSRGAAAPHLQVVKGVDLLAPLSKMQHCWEGRDYDCTGDQLNTLIGLLAG